MAEDSPQTKKWKKEVSAGGIVYKKQDGREFVLLIMPKGDNYGPPVGYWTFPKGMLDHDGEDFKETAVREVKEETGIDAEIEQELGYIRFFKGASRKSNSSPAIKFVHYFLMKYVSGDTNSHDAETAQAAWFETSEVFDKLKFKHDKEIFQKALNALDKNK